MRIPHLDRLGRPGIVGLGLLLFCLSFYLGSIEPAQRELSRLEQDMAELAAKRPTGEAGATDQGAGPAPLPPLSTAPEVVKALSGLAQQHGMPMDRASFILSDQGARPRLEVLLPLKAGYPSLRAFLRDLLTLEPAPVVDELVFQRQQAGEAQVEANVRLSYHFLPSP